MDKFRAGHKIKCIKTYEECNRIIFLKGDIYEVKNYSNSHYTNVPVIDGKDHQLRIANHESIAPNFIIYKKELHSETDFLDAFKENESRYYD